MAGGISQLGFRTVHLLLHRDGEGDGGIVGESEVRWTSKWQNRGSVHFFGLVVGYRLLDLLLHRDGEGDGEVVGERGSGLRV